MKSQEHNQEHVERYVALCDRAVAYVEAQGGVVAEDILIGHVFGSSTSPTIWRPLLRNVLDGDDRLLFRANGEWFIPTNGTSADPGRLVLGSFVALDVETTGLKPSRHRVIEIALLRYRDGVLERRYERLLNPGRLIPEFITRLTTIRNEDVAEAETFAEIAQDVLDFIGEDVLIGHNVAFDIGFINAELDRIGKPMLVNERIDTMGLATRLLRDVRKPSLDRVATAVGLSPRGVHRAGGDAQLTAEVALRLMGEAANQGIASVDRLKSVAFVPETRVQEGVGRARSVLDRTLAHNLPKKPGVYIMRDTRGEIVYVGKAKNLRSRVGSYYSQPIGMTRKMDGLIENVAAIDHEVVGSELEALQLESQFIRRYQPRYNTALKKSEHYPYIKVDVANPWPRVLVAKTVKDDGARYFGPYTSATSARKTVDVINACLQLRTCTRSFKSASSYGKPCIALDLHQCLGPCTGKADKEVYRRKITSVLQMLEGDDSTVYDWLHAQLEESAEKLDFERADRIRRNILNFTAIMTEQQRTRDAHSLHNITLVMRGPIENSRDIWLVLHGTLWARFMVDTSDSEAGSDLAERLERSLARAATEPSRPRDHHQVDEAGILTRFLFRNEGSEALVPLAMTDDGVVADTPGDIARRALAVTEEAIEALDVNRKIETDSEVDQPDALDVSMVP